MDEWYYASDNQQLGPITHAALREMAASGQLKPTDLVWVEGMSQWAPASTEPGLFSAPSQPAPPPPPAPVSVVPRQLEQADEKPRDVRRISNRQSSSWSATTKLLIAGGVGFVVVLLLVVVGAGIVMYNARIGSPDSHGTYAVNLKIAGQFDTRSVQFQRSQRVHITVTTTKWSGRHEPDVDVYIYDENENLIAEDKGPEKDCDVVFIAPRTGSYKIVVVLDQGANVECTVRH